MTPDTDTNNPPPVQPHCGHPVRSGALSASDEPHALNASAAPPAPAPAPVAAAKTMPLDDYLLLSGMLRISQQHARAWGLYDEQGNPIYPAGVLSHPFQTDKLPATADAPALLRASLVQPAPVAADADLDALLALVRGMVATAKEATPGEWELYGSHWVSTPSGSPIVEANWWYDAAHIAACNPAAIQRLGELVERVAKPATFHGLTAENLTAQIRTAQAERDEVLDALDALHDWQNGPPIVKYADAVLHVVEKDASERHNDMADRLDREAREKGAAT